MKIILALDKFKGSLSALEACELVKEGLLKVRSDLRILLRPMADGGEGTAEALLNAGDGIWCQASVTGPLPNMKINARYGWIDTSQTAIIEMAKASGISLLTESQRNPLETTTYGTGELIADALRKNPLQILLTVGGSATIDGGMGAAAALGWKFFDESGRQIGLGGKELSRIATLVPPDLRLPKVAVLCDVSNVLTGPHGAAQVFGRQKGATDEMITQLDLGLSQLAKVVRRQLGIEIENTPMAGAAGGLAGGSVAFLNGILQSGIDTVIKMINFEESVEDADWVITGEGSFDEQSLGGKVVSGVCRSAKAYGSKIGVIAGISTFDPATAKDIGIADIVSLCRPGIARDFAIRNSRELILQRAIEFAQRNL